VNPIRLVTGALTLPAHAAAAVIGTSVGVATTGVRTTARVVGRVIEEMSGSGHAPSAPWPADRPRTAAEVDPLLGARRPATAVPPAGAAPSSTAASALETETEVPVTSATAKKSPARKTAAKKAPAKKAPARKAPARRAPSKQAAVLAPALGLSEAEVAAELDAAGDEILTPSGIPAAGEGYNPDTTDTDLHQPGTEPLMDPATVKAAASESDMMRRAAETDKG
jgi:hypothetical protein